MQPEWMLALRYLRPGRKDSFISIVGGLSFFGIMLGVATLIVVMSVMNGFKAELMGRILGMNGHIGVFYHGEPAQPYQETQKILESVHGVSRVYALVEGQSMLLAHGHARGGFVHGLEKEALLTRPSFSTSLVAGSLDDFQGQVVFLGQKLADLLRVSVGDEIVLASPKVTPTALGGLPKFRRFLVGGLFHLGMNEYDQTFVFMPLEAAQTFLGTGTGVSGFEVFVENPMDVKPVVRLMRGALSGMGLRVVDWQEANASFFSVVEVERNVMFIILMLIIVVAAFNVISSLVMLVKDKARDIAILRAMGARKAMVCRLFLWVGASLGVLGTVCGLGLGLLIAYNMEPIRQLMERLTGASLFPAEFYFLSQLPSKVELVEVFWVAGLAIGLTILSSLYPALRAARLQPHQALRFE